MESKNRENEDSGLDQPESTNTSKGIFITKGMHITIPPGGLKLAFSDDGAIQSANLSLHVGLDMSPYWLKIACQHLDAAEINNGDVHLALAASNEQAMGLALEKEFSSAMQAVTAAAIALDAFYAMVKERIDIPQEQLNAWKEHGTARYKQIHEVLRRAFSVPANSEKQMREVIVQAARFRDEAVHPSPKLAAPILHPELEQYMEARFVKYRFQNAKPVVGTILSLIAQLPLRPKQKYPQLKQYCEGLESAILPLVEAWESRYGLLYDRANEMPAEPSDH